MKLIKNKITAGKILALEIRKRLPLKRSTKSNIGYIGGHGVRNLGDDAMFNAFKENIPEYNVITLQSIGVEKALSIVGLSGKSFFEKFILGGGTLINEMWFDKVKRSLSFDVPLISLGTGVGSCGIEQPYETRFSFWREVLQQFQFVGVRGNMSRRRLKEIDVDSEVVGDLALLLGDSDIKKEYEKLIILNLMDIQEYNHFWEKMIPHLKSYLKEGWDIKPLIINPNDLPYTKRYFNELGLSEPMAVTETYNSFEQAVKGAALCISVRLHSGVLSLCYNIPTILIGYRDKCEDFMDSLDLMHSYVSVEKEITLKEFSILEKVDNLLDKDKNIEERQKISKKVNFYKEKLQKAIKEQVK
ncbi:polysaccharide pyruvyl transferase family protein [Salinimicrobium terrae]|uniref:polysaccharide pyruvyl transferase family protein n=1 Tax=Salinimicrobium terrae TaxID=470866 RepID=UPI0004114046|nr:polysaccharide pyruvyl transferase family protein [Salinimicrobium terrae]